MIRVFMGQLLSELKAQRHEEVLQQQQQLVLVRVYTEIRLR